MATTPAPNPRASLLSGLRTGGVRSSSSPVQHIPHTAAPGGSFNIPRFNAAVYPPEDEEDELSDMVAQNLYINPGNYSNRRQQPLTAAVDGPNNRFSQQQGHTQTNNGGFPMSATGFGVRDMQAQAQAQAIQMQMVQMEIIRLQALQAQQYQAELMAQVQRQQQAQNGRRASAQFNPPATAAPSTTSFDLRSAAMNAQMRRATQDQQMKGHLGGGDDQVPMTAALGGKFGGRMASLITPRYNDEQEVSNNVPPATPGRTTVISGGTSLGSLISNNLNNEGAAPAPAPAPSKSDAASSWRRGGNNNSVLSGNRVASLPNVKVSPPPSDRVSPPPNQAPQSKTRPQPLQFGMAVQQSLPAVQIDTTEGNEAEDDSSSTTSSRSGGAGSPQLSPLTPPHSSSSHGSNPPLSPREEASKKLYEGLGIGRPIPQGPAPQTVASHRMASQPVRQPRGPPSGADELGPKNFATRIRRKAIGGLEMLMGARERREVEAF
ncbi:hypothetical protein OE88DRAFT_1722993 [Heliocybe sulcata]|uniref:Uncharacterized protein n=1 Tax=Heliocybe sulcata TaxID=5364 RepID=A0A5C3NIY9_9AGAM|nr:hypothetical protein OE88DRAFT_1722993 [Heliocybe sulcata]